MIAIGTEEGRENAERLVKLVGLKRGASEVVQLESAQSLEEAYRAANDLLRRLDEEGVPPENIVIHYTAGTKVMSAGLVLAGVGHGCRCLRYLFSAGPGSGASSPVNVSSAAVRAEGDIRRATLLLRDFRFRSAADLLRTVDPSLLSDKSIDRWKSLKVLSGAYAAWDNFRVRRFLRDYRSLRGKIEAARELTLAPETLKALDRIAKVDRSVGTYPVELIYDLYNNAVRRLMERRTDDAVVRLCRAGELFAQNLLMANFRIRTDDVEIRKVPPRQRVLFEALRRLDDAKIKIGLRKSYELLSYLGHPVGQAFVQNDALSGILAERRHVVLFHGTQPAQTRVAMELHDELLALFRLEISDFSGAAARQQFPWIDNADVLTRLRAVKEEDTPVTSQEQPQKAPAASDRPRNASPRKGRKTAR